MSLGYGWSRALDFEEQLEMLREPLALRLGQAVTGARSIHAVHRQSSAVRCCELLLADGTCHRVWVKCLHASPRKVAARDLRTARDYDVTAHLFGAFPAGSVWAVPEPLLFLPEHRLIVTKHVEGARLQNKLTQRFVGLRRESAAHELGRDFQKVGQWLKMFQRSTVSYCPGDGLGLPPLEAKSPAFIVSQAERRLNACEALIESDTTWIGDARRYLRGELSQADCGDTEAAWCGIHGDFFAGNVLVSDDGVAGIDFSSATWGTPLFDPAYCLFQLDTLTSKPFVRRESIDGLALQFLRGFGWDGGVRDFWTSDPTARILYVALRISRVLSLIHTEGNSPLRHLWRQLLAKRTVGEMERWINGPSPG